MDKDIIYWIWISRINTVSNLKKKMLINTYKSPKKIFYMNQIELGKCLILSKTEINELLKLEYRKDLEKYKNFIIKNNIHVIGFTSSLYPSKLNYIYDQPIVLYAKGNIELLNMPAIAIVGCRKCSQYGIGVTKKMAYNLALNNICIISGLAIGIDTCAHIGALAANGSTIAVLGSGICNIYPAENKWLCNEIIKRNGLVISEYLIDSKAEKNNFPQRNRIISGLSDGILATEAGEKSGALITVDFALEQGKEIFAIPGNINSSTSIGTNNLIREGANIVTDYSEIIQICYNH